MPILILYMDILNHNQINHLYDILVAKYGKDHHHNYEISIPCQHKDKYDHHRCKNHVDFMDLDCYVIFHEVNYLTNLAI